ncbi:LuxR C-terminal-related transcriptional regulator [Kalamiella sp. sgz302252]|uniref:LuxR C-terminal-related transcriptional regulator n=1 Tax=Pantoea sp. sgz302252 TaxID=3341827 RepID=UPI0036D3A49D
MNIMLISRDNFFVTGAIALISQVWRPDFKTHPVFVVAERNNPLLLPDVVITDMTDIRQSDLASGIRSARKGCVVDIFLATQSRQGKLARSTEYHIFLDKKEAAQQLVGLFGTQTSALFWPSPLSSKARSSLHQSPGPLSKQQAMVLSYTRQGLSLTDISRVTRLSIKTISTHKRAIMRKLGIKNNGEFYQYAFSEGVAQEA